jgi:(E)-4-hydroxy-3-methylbut-2-enyl-diphosphate synthase
MMKTKVNCGGIEIGGDASVSIQSMTNTKTADTEATIAQCRRLMEAGCDIIRITVNTKEAAEGFARIRKKIDAPLVADIHFDYTLALAAINAGADKIRINPGNIGDTDRVRQVANACAKAGIPIRVGVNSGSLEKEILAKYGGVCAAGLAESAIKNAAILERLGFNDIVLSLKASDVRMNNEAYRIVDKKSCYPLHIGVTEAGTVSSGIIKSSIGIGALLLDGIGDTMRVSLTADPVREVAAAKEILKALDLREGAIEIVSCPTCGRTEVDLEKIASEIEARLSVIEAARAGGKKLKVAVMGCAVNGPGEAKEADIGVACGRGEALIFRRGEIIKKVKESEITEETARIVREYENL